MISVGGFGIERAGRLVGPDDGGIVHERAGDGDALALTAGKLRGLVPGPIRETDRVQRGHRPLPRARLV